MSLSHVHLECATLHASDANPCPKQQKVNGKVKTFACDSSDMQGVFTSWRTLGKLYIF